jgi:hypothetical protein
MNEQLIKDKLMKDNLFRNHHLGEIPPKYDGNVWKIEPSILDENPSVEKTINWIRRYMRFPLTIDNFSLNPNTEYNLRRLWKKELAKRYGDDVYEFFNRNKLKTNCLTGLQSSILTIDEFLKEKMPRLNEEIGELNGLIMSMGENYCEYKKMNLTGRIDFIRRIEDKTYCILWELHADD